MKESHYGGIKQRELHDRVAGFVEEVSVRGFTVIPNLIDEKDLNSWRKKIDTVYNSQEEEFGREKLLAIQELDVCRAPLLYDFDFIQLAANALVLEVIKQFLGDFFILNLQNAIINRPNITHHQSSWHRDLPYQHFVISRPLAINMLLTVDEFSEETGGTHVLPFSHKSEILPSDTYLDTNKVMVNAPAGSAIIFDAMLFHRAGSNQSSTIRRGVNHLYTVPIIKQQYDFSRALGKKVDFDQNIAMLLGYTSQVPIDDREWRKARTK